MDQQYFLSCISRISYLNAVCPPHSSSLKTMKYYIVTRSDAAQWLKLTHLHTNTLVLPTSFISSPGWFITRLTSHQPSQPASQLTNRSASSIATFYILHNFSFKSLFFVFLCLFCVKVVAVASAAACVIFSFQLIFHVSVSLVVIIWARDFFGSLCVCLCILHSSNSLSARSIFLPIGMCVSECVMAVLLEKGGSAYYLKLKVFPHFFFLNMGLRPFLSWTSWPCYGLKNVACFLSFPCCVLLLFVFLPSIWSRQKLN